MAHEGGGSVSFGRECFRAFPRFLSYAGTAAWPQIPQRGTDKTATTLAGRGAVSNLTRPWRAPGPGPRLPGVRELS